MRHTFQVDLRGMIDLLSEHLYAGPEVYLRELIQNGMDAITARRVQEPGHPGRLALDVTPTGEGAPRLTFEDDGVGLDEHGIHTFLATIGRSSKRGEQDFIGQFGIGLLSCFVVADEIELVSRAVQGADPVRWVGYADGQYTLAVLTGEEAAAVGVGTRVVLRAKPGREHYFEPDRVREWCARYAALLSYPVEVREGDATRVVNDRPAPWVSERPDPLAQRAALIDYGADLLGVDPFDAVPIRTSAGNVRGVAYVLPWTPTLAVRGRHRVYLRGMLLSEDSEHLVPDWAFFVKCVLDTRDLRPNAARDALHEDATLALARDEVGRVLRDYLLGLAEHDPARLRAFIALHYLSIKALAVEDAEFFELFVPWLPFETSLGRITLPEYLRRAGRIRYVSDVHLFRQVGQVAVASGQAVVHAVYTHDAALLEKYATLHPEVSVERLDAAGFAADLADLAPEERREHAAFVRAANEVLLELGCEARLVRFDPADLPALYLKRAGGHARAVRRPQAHEGGLWTDVLGDLDDVLDEEPLSALHLNLASPLVRRAAHLHDDRLVRRVVGMLYVQALLVGHHPLGARELRLLNDGMLDLVSSSPSEFSRLLN